MGGRSLKPHINTCFSTPDLSAGSEPEPKDNHARLQQCAISSELLGVYIGSCSVLVCSFFQLVTHLRFVAAETTFLFIYFALEWRQVKAS